MSQPTQLYKRSLSGSIGAGMGSLFGGSGKQYYILEHKISSKYHKAGESQEIIVDQIELGRDPRCQVRFDESFATVGRRHAAIVKDGDKWKLVHLSQTNPTFLNGRPVQHEWYLQNGDDIQLSIGGPRLGFIIPTGNKSTVGSIGLSRRLSLFRQQALKPYKTAITVLGVLLFLAVGGLTSWNIYERNYWTKITTEAEKQRKEDMEREKARQDSIIAVHKKEMAKVMADKEELSKKLSALSRKVQDIGNIGIKQNSTNAAIDACMPHVYFIWVDKVVWSINEESGEISGLGSGTGFLLDDKRFVTARHVVEPWYFLDNELENTLNWVANNGGKVVAYLTAYSPTGNSFSFTSEQVFCDRSHDETSVTEDGYVIKKAFLNNTDWAYTRTNLSGGLKFDNAKSNELERGEELTVIGFPLGIGANSANDIEPISVKAMVAKNGLDNRGDILTTNTNYEKGNSGGPVFYTDSSGKLVVIGIVSAIAGRSTGFVVPISAAR